MAIFAISDLHLPLGVDKPMDVFGARWANYVSRLEKNWRNIVSPEDCVIVPGDISWATYLEEAEPDLRFLDSLPGLKLISKGNHDYWWGSITAMRRFCDERGFSSLVFLHNIAYRYRDTAIYASRGWLTPHDADYAVSKDEKIYQREQIRLRLSIQAAKALGASHLIGAIHYPPHEAFSEIISQCDTDICVYGHLHNVSCEEKIGKMTNTHLVSADFLEFSPMKISD